MRLIESKLLAVLAGICLAVGVLGHAADAAETQELSARPIAVADFRIDPTLVRTDPGPGGEIGILAERAKRGPGILNRRKKSPEQVAAEVVTVFGKALVEALAKAGFTAQRNAPGAPFPTQGLVIQGQFLTVSEGNAVKQATVGFGAGAPAIEVAGTLSDLATNPPTTLLQFGGINPQKNMPGGLIMKSPVAMGAKFVLAKDATDKDVKKLAVRMAEDIIKFLHGNGEAPRTP